MTKGILKYCITALLLLLAYSNSLFAQSNLVFGTVTDKDNAPMEYVSVSLLNNAKPIGTTTDKHGKYSLKIPKNGQVTIRFSFTGCESQDFTFTTNGTTKQEINCKLLPSSTTLEQVTVREERTRNTTFTPIKIEKIGDVVGPAATVESLIKTLADVSSNNEMSSQYSVRGGSFDENLVYINDVEIYRPFLVRSGQQEGLSIINPDMVSNIQFSPGGFDAKYGDKMSSVLDITYRRPIDRIAGQASVSLLGGSAHVESAVNDRLSVSLGFRRHSNKYLFKSLDTEGAYTSAYTDFQAIINYEISKKLSLSFLGIYSQNRYGLIPESQTTNFGNFFESMQLRVYFDGQEIDKYRTLLGAVTLDYRPTNKLSFKWITSAYNNKESEVYDIQGQYWLYELNVGSVIGENELFDRGIGTYLEHARNFLTTGVTSTEIKGLYLAGNGRWEFGAKAQHEAIDDKIREWKLIDSADYTIPSIADIPGDSANIPHAPYLQNFAHSQNDLNNNRLSAYVQRSWDFDIGKNKLSLLAGVRGQYWSYKDEFFASPRLSLNYKPNWKQDMLFRLAGGMYNQSPFYREYRRPDGSLNPDIKSQKSYQVSGTLDWNLRLWDKPFKFTADIYYKYITDLIPYQIDNLRIRYLANNDAVGYATGVSLRLNGEFVEGIESWASLSLMQTQEKLFDDETQTWGGWQARPTDQRLSFKLFFQDYLPSLPWWQMSLNFVYGTGFPFSKPFQTDFSVTHRLPSYFRVDWGNSVHLKKIGKLKNAKWLQKIDDVVVGVDVFNLFNYKNVVSYLWVADYDNKYYGVPNYLTARQINVKLTVIF